MSNEEEVEFDSPYTWSKRKAFWVKKDIDPYCIIPMYRLMIFAVVPRNQLVMGLDVTADRMFFNVELSLFKVRLGISIRYRDIPKEKVRKNGLTLVKKGKANE